MTYKAIARLMEKGKRIGIVFLGEDGIEYKLRDFEIHALMNSNCTFDVRETKQGIRFKDKRKLSDLPERVDSVNRTVSEGITVYYGEELKNYIGIHGTRNCKSLDKMIHGINSLGWIGVHGTVEGNGTGLLLGVAKALLDSGKQVSYFRVNGVVSAEEAVKRIGSEIHYTDYYIIDGFEQIQGRVNLKGISFSKNGYAPHGIIATSDKLEINGTYMGYSYHSCLEQGIKADSYSKNGGHKSKPKEYTTFIDENIVKVVAECPKLKDYMIKAVRDTVYYIIIKSMVLLSEDAEKQNKHIETKTMKLLRKVVGRKPNVLVQEQNLIYRYLLGMGVLYTVKEEEKGFAGKGTKTYLYSQYLFHTFAKEELGLLLSKTMDNMIVGHIMDIKSIYGHLLYEKTDTGYGFLYFELCNNEPVTLYVIATDKDTLSTLTNTYRDTRKIYTFRDVPIRSIKVVLLDTAESVKGFLTKAWYVN